MGRCGRRSIIKSSISSRNEEVDDVDMLVFELRKLVWNQFTVQEMVNNPLGSFNNYVTQNYKILTYLPIFVTLFYNKISSYM